MPRFRPDDDPTILRLADEARGRAVRNVDTEPLASLSLESWRVDPPVDPAARSHADTIARFLRTHALPRRTPAPHPRLITVDALEAQLWNGLVHGLVCECGPFDDAPGRAQDWIAELYLAVAEGQGARCFEVRGLFGPSVARTHILLGPRRIALVTQIGWD